MRDYSVWSLSLGRWGGVQIRLHMFLLLFAAFTLYLAWAEGRAEAPPHDANGQAAAQLGGEMVALALGSLLILFVSVLGHALGHLLTAIRLGGGTDTLILGPLGELNYIHVPYEPQKDIVATLAGPLVNLSVCVALAPLLWMADVRLLGLLHPLAPSELLTGGNVWLTALKLSFWINWILLLANLIPAFPFDGGRALRAILTTAGSVGDSRKASQIVARLAMFASAGLLIVAFFMWSAAPAGTVPTWFALVLLAIFLFFSARQEEHRAEEDDFEDDLFGYDFSRGYTSLEQSSEPRPQPGFISQWLKRRREAKLRRQEETEAEEDRRMDEILIRLHEQGPNSLSREERKLLDRVSARYRSRQA